MDSRDGRSKVEMLLEIASIVFNASPDTEQKILETGRHSPNESKMDVWPILHIVEKIFTRAPLNVVITGILDMDVEVEVHHRVQMPEKMDEQAYQDRKRQAEAIYDKIDSISSQLGKSLKSSDEHETTMSLLTMLSGYSWDAKLILTLAAFALNYGEFICKKLPALMDDFDDLREIIKIMLKLARCIVAFKRHPDSMYMESVWNTSETGSSYAHSTDVHATRLECDAWSNANKVIPLAVYYAVISVVICAKKIAASLGHETASSLLEKYSLNIWWLGFIMQGFILEYLQKQLDICCLNIDEKKKVAAYESLVRCIDENHSDNMKVLKALICSKDGMEPIFNGSSNTKEHVDVLKSKNVLLLISSLDNYQEELSILKRLYDESRQHFTGMDSTYKVVWVPIVDLWKEDPMQNQFETLRSTMPWYTVHHPEIIDDAVKRLVKERWNFKNKPILVVLDPQGRVVSPNALHMMWIWGNKAFPFSSLEEEALWKAETWRLELLVNDIDPMVLDWIKEGKYIFLYGGTDIKWIRKFTSAARSMASTACIPLEMIYVEKCAGKREVRHVMETMTAENLSHTWQDAMICLFWTRLESMLFSKIQLDRINNMTQEIEKLFSYDKNGGWAVLSHGNEVIVNGHGTTVLPTLLQYDTWKEQIQDKGFGKSLKEHHDKLQRDSPPCCRFEFPSADGRVPDCITCPQCCREIYDYTTFLCCHDP